MIEFFSFVSAYCAESSASVFVYMACGSSDSFANVTDGVTVVGINVTRNSHVGAASVVAGVVTIVCEFVRGRLSLKLANVTYTVASA